MPSKKEIAALKGLKFIEFREAQQQQFFEKNTLNNEKMSFIAGVSKMRELFIKPFNVVQEIMDAKYPLYDEQQEALIQYACLSQRESASARILTMNEIYRRITNNKKSQITDQLLNAMVYLAKISESDAKIQLGLPTTAQGAQAYVDKLCNAFANGQTIDEEADLKVELYE